MGVVVRKTQYCGSPEEKEGVSSGGRGIKEGGVISPGL